jgi:hypothetical protein
MYGCEEKSHLDHLQINLFGSCVLVAASYRWLESPRRTNKIKQLCWQEQQRERASLFLFARVAVIATNQISRFRGRLPAVFDFPAPSDFTVPWVFFFFCSAILFPLELYGEPPLLRPELLRPRPDPDPNGISARHLYFVSSRLASHFWRNKSAINHIIPFSRVCRTRSYMCRTL